MILTEQVTDKLQKLPIAAQKEVLDFIELLVEKTARRAVASGQVENINGEQKAQRIERWAKSHSSKTPVIIDDSRETIYEN